MSGNSAVPEHYPKIPLCVCVCVMPLPCSLQKRLFLGNYNHEERKEQKWQARRGESKKQRNDKKV